MNTYIVKIVSILFLSCLGRADNNVIQIYHINPTSMDVGLFSDYFEDIKYIKLELDPHNPIGNIKQLIYANNSYYILDNLTNKVFKYDIEGNFIFVINKNGKGPGEYTKIASISINTIDSLLIIFDKLGKAIKYYSMMEGSFQRSTSLKDLPNSITYVGDGKIAAFMCFYSRNQTLNNLLYFTNPDRITNQFLPYTHEENFPYYTTKMFTMKDGKIYFMPPFYDQVFLLDANNCIPKLQLDFGRYKFQGKIFDGANFSGEKFDKLYKSDMVYTKSDFYEFQDYYYFSFAWKGVRKIAFLNKTDRRVSVFKNLKNDINGFSTGTLIASVDNGMYYVVEPYDILGRRNHFYNKSKDSSISDKEREGCKRYCLRVDSVFGQISETDNPIIAIYNLK